MAGNPKQSCAALAVGSLCSIHRLRAWRVPGRALALGVYGLFGFHFLLFVALRLAPPVEANQGASGLADAAATWDGPLHDCRKASGSGFIPFIGVTSGAVDITGAVLMTP